MTTEHPTADQLAKFYEASNHPYECKCAICKEWWRLCGPEIGDNDEEDGYGPFGETLLDDEDEIAADYFDEIGDPFK